MRRVERLVQVGVAALLLVAAGGPWAAPVELTIDAHRISVRQRGAATAPERSPGWLIDLGERAKDQPPAQTLQLQWPQGAEFTAPYTLEHSADLRQSRAATGGQLLALSAAPPQITGARSATQASISKALDAPTDIDVAASPEPPGPHAGAPAPRSLHFDLGAALPLHRVDLQPPAGNWVLPLRVQARERADSPWEPVAGTVFYRFERGSEVSRSPALVVQRGARYLRLLPDERASLLLADSLRLLARAQLVSLVFAAQGQPLYVLMAGAAKASSGALPITTLVPDLERERERLGQATLGAWSEAPEAVVQAQTQQRLAALRPWMLWTPLLGGVAALGWMVWRLLRADRV